MSDPTPKQLLERAFADLAEGDGRRFVDLMADDFSWIIAGHSPWSGCWRGKQAVREQLLKPLFARFASTYRNRATRLIGEGDHVVVQCEGDVMTQRGSRYHNQYCYVCSFRDGRMHELVEYMDTAHALEALGPP